MIKTTKANIVVAGITTYIIRRLLFMIPVFLGVSILTFAISNAAGDPIALIRQGIRSAPPQVLEALKAYYHVNDPLYIRYLYWLWICCISIWAGVSLERSLSTEWGRGS